LKQIALRPNPESVKTWMKKFYFPSHLRLGSWIIGIALGFFMYQTRGERIKISRPVDVFMWVLSISVISTVLLKVHSFQQLEDHKMSFIANVTFNSLFRIGWSLALSWIIFACQNGSGGFVRWFLSHRFWQPLGRMGLSIYLVHRIYQIITTHNQKQIIYWDFFTELQKYFGDVLVAIILGIVLYLAVETPVMLVENYLHNKFTQPKQKVIQENTNL
jgi:peptidoglycan/LPS O-acetylase OafA/YrhL